MAVTTEAHIKRFRGLSTDEKPGRTDASRPPGGSRFTEYDTGRRFVWLGSWPWTREEQTVEGLLGDLLETNERILSRLDATHRGHEEYVWDEDVPIEE